LIAPLFYVDRNWLIRPPAKVKAQSFSKLFSSTLLCRPNSTKTLPIPYPLTFAGSLLTLRMTYQELDIDTPKPVLSWAGHDLAPPETKMAKNVASLPFVFKHVALMPDVHLGKGALVGSVIATKDALIPAAVGVDIGCGMMAIQTPFKGEKLDGKLKKIRLDLEAQIPVGFEENKDISKAATNWQGWQDFDELHRGVRGLETKAIKQLGSLGGGNHFIEVCIDTEHKVWLMLHSGSRNIGNKLAQCHIDTAKDLAKLADLSLPDRDLAYFVAGTPEFAAYWRDLQWAQGYARTNREVMMARFIRVMEQHLNGGKKMKPLLSIDCHHNYAEQEVHFGEEVYVTRKGAVRARSDDYGIIPGSMGTKSYIVKGKGNAQSFCSCSHGAGRMMSRSMAKNTYTLDDLIAQTSGVECRKDPELLDEIPSAYKPIERVMANQADLVEVVATLKQVVCIKG
jgi:tRNA-splicing ligase RtcB (3'-phosphate/5'-hydroxy nucleic acid ligase)